MEQKTIDLGFDKEHQQKLNKEFEHSSVIKPSRKKGYVKVHSIYLLEELDWIRKNSRLQKEASGKTATQIMVDHLLMWMAYQEVPWYVKLLSLIPGFNHMDRTYKEWILIRNDHWLVNQEARNKWLNLNLI